MDITSPKQQDKRSEKYPDEGIATDCAHSLKHGVTQFRGVDLRTGNQLLFEDIGGGKYFRRLSPFEVRRAIKNKVEILDSYKR